MAERVTGKTWEELIREYIFQPLGMTHAGFGSTAGPGMLYGLVGHHFDDFGIPVPQPPQDVPVAGPAGTIHASMEDWGKFIADMLRGLEGRGSLLLPATYEHLHTPSFGGSYAYG